MPTTTTTIDCLYLSIHTLLFLCQGRWIVTRCLGLVRHSSASMSTSSSIYSTNTTEEGLIRYVTKTTD